MAPRSSRRIAEPQDASAWQAEGPYAVATKPASSGLGRAIAQWILSPLLAAAFVGFLVSAVVHVAALLGFDLLLDRPRVSQALYVGVFVTLFPAVIVGAGSQMRRGRWRPLAVPRPLIVLVVVLAVYAIGNAAYLDGFLSGAKPSLVDGRYVVVEEDGTSRPSSLRAYRRLRRLDTRLSTGHCQLFYASSFILLLGQRRLLRGEAKFS